MGNCTKSIMGIQRIKWKSNQPIVGIELTNWELYKTHYGKQRIEWKSNQPIVGIELTNWELYKTHYGNTTD